ncbi:hypothetical protein CVT24_006185 [Panaeolus cyanescens]|uniref:G-patch domain-containing protein n=1 Tax=Panaeolus cyanescens TaxID=181874 RepID=A0A409VCR4_9AGAR|nr:hypothetical protein CVT24_006185 [Panaeolus cyanescens]
MGLSGRKTKQRIGDDPRNLNWADDAARFGSSYLAKFGWDASKGLGAGGEGRTSHIKVSQKLDMLGIGADHRRDPNGIAWKQNKDFENLLKRLNEAQVDQGDVKMKDESDDGEDNVEVGKKRKKRDAEDGKKKKKKKESVKETTLEEVTTTTTTTEVVQKTVTKTSVVPRHRAHRARHIAAKNISSKASSHISEILGIAPAASSSSSPDDTPKGTLTPISDELEIDKITTSTKSVADYFKEKLKAKSTPAVSSSSDSSDSPADEDYEAPRMGLGASKLRFEISSSSTTEHAETRSLSAFASLKSASLLASFSAASSTTQMSFYKEAVETDMDVDEESSPKIVEVVEAEEKTSGKKKKDKKGRKGETDKKGKSKMVEKSEDSAHEKDGHTLPLATSKKEKKKKHKESEVSSQEKKHEKKKKGAKQRKNGNRARNQIR